MSIDFIDGGIPTPFPPPTGGSSLFPPTSFAITSVTTTSMFFSWTPPVQGTAIGFRVLDDADDSVVDTVAWGTNTSSVTGLSPGTTKTYKVVTYDADEQSVASNTDTDTTSSNSELYTPQNFARTLTQTTSSSIEYTWDAPLQGTALGYYIFDNATGLAVTNAIPFSSNVATVTGLSANTAYVHKIATYDTLGFSSFSNTAGDTTAVASATLLYSENFENGFLMGTPNPVLGTIINDEAGMVSAGNLFEIDTTIFNTGTQSLRVNFAGRNGRCNTPFNGTDKTESQLAGHDNVQYFISSAGTDLSLEVIGTGNAAQILKNSWTHQVGDIVMNLDNGYSTWIITNFSTTISTNDTLLLTPVLPPIDSTPASFYGGDNVIIYHVLDELNERANDCDVAIMNLNKLTLVDGWGEWYYHRKYFRVGSTNMPYHLKLFYIQKTVGFAACDESASPTVPHGLVSYHGKSTGNKQLLKAFQDLTLDTWYYFEIGMKAESFDGAYDGEIRVWLYEKGQELTTPLFVDTDLRSSGLRVDIHHSVFGNWQHSKTCTGYVWIDDVQVATDYIGPIV